LLADRIASFAGMINDSKEVKSVPRGNRTPVAGVKGQCPRPLDDGDVYVGRARLELATLCLKGRYSTSLS
jgi:hypothetical protein